MSADTSGPLRVGVAPGSPLRVDSRLTDALALAFGVAFVTAPEPGAGLAGWITGPRSGAGAPGVRRCPELVLTGPSARSRATAGTVRFAAGADERLALRAMTERATPVVPLALRDGEEAIAGGDVGPLWTIDRRGGAPVLRSGACVPHLPPATPLKALLTGGTFLGLLPLVDFLRRVTGYDAWGRPETLGAIVIDDPNLRSVRYGFVHFGEVAATAARADGHVVMATVPLDHRLAAPAASAVLRDSPHLSLAVHGNNHTRHELARGMDDPMVALTTAAQALRRARSLADRARVPVSPVMVPPHEVTSRHVLPALARVGFASICWMGPVDAGTDAQLVGWDPADVHFPGGLPGIHRDFLDASVEELVWRTYLDQPTIVHGHHGDFAGGPGLVAELTDRLRQAGAVRCGGLDAISRSRLYRRRDGNSLTVRPYGRTVDVVVDPGVDEVRVEIPRALGTATAAVRIGDRDVPVQGGTAGPFALEPAGRPSRLRVELLAAAHMDPRLVAGPPPTPWPLVRRLLTEARDRAEPLIADISRTTRSAT